MSTYTTNHGNPLWLVFLALSPIVASLSLTTVVMADSVVEVQSPRDETQSATEMDEADDTKTTKQLRVAPLDQIEYPEDRPQWIDDDPDLVDDTHSWVAVSMPSDTPQQSDESLELMQTIATELYANRLLDSEEKDGAFTLSHDWIDRNKDRLVAKRYAGELTQGDMKLYESAVQLRFTPQVQQEIREQWKNQEVTRRLGLLGLLGFIGTVLLGCGSATLGIFSRRVERQDQPHATDS